jgi:hypothetical protein
LLVDVEQVLSKAENKKDSEYVVTMQNAGRDIWQKCHRRKAASRVSTDWFNSGDPFGDFEDLLQGKSGYRGQAPLLQ